jgi:hypothetical protein
MNSTPSAQTTRQDILILLDQLPPDSLPMVETFIRFMQTQPEQAKPKPLQTSTPWLYPTVPVPAANLDRLVGIMPDIEGDALADTEMLYDEV